MTVAEKLRGLADMSEQDPWDWTDEDPDTWDDDSIPVNIYGEHDADD